MTTSEGADDAMHAAAQRQCTSLAPVCKWFVRSGTCRSKSCPLPHVKLTDNFQTAASYDERVWSLSSTEDDEPAAGQTWRFSIASYNILADKYARHYRSYLYHEVPATYLDWHHRRSTILAELAYLLPDIICLQEVDRFEDLEEELEQLGYSGIYLQRDGGRRDGCATFWRHDLLRPAVVRPVRFSQFDLKDNVALLVLFEPRTGRHTANNPIAAAAGATRHQQQTNSQAWDRQQHSQQANGLQQQQQLYGQSPRQDPLTQWLPKGWLWSNSSNSSSSSHTRSSQVLLRPVHPHGQISTHQCSPGSLYQIPTLLQEHHQQQQQQQQQGFQSSLDAAAANGSQSSSSAVRRGHRRSGSGGSSRRQSLEQQLRERRAEAAQEQQQQQHAPDWARCGLLVANTHIIFTPDKGEVKLGQARLLVQEAAQLAEWYLSQQQQQNSTPNGSSSDPLAQTAACSPSLDAGMQAVAAILTGDFNATPHSPLYTYMSSGLLDLQTVNKRNVSHMASSSSSSSHHHKGYRGFRRTNRRRSAEYQQQQQQQEAATLAGGYQPQAQQQQQQDILAIPKQQQQQARVAVTADARGSLQSQHASVVAAAASAGTGSSPPAAAGSGASQQQPYAEQHSSASGSWRLSPGTAVSGVSGGPAGSSKSSSSTQQVPVNPTGQPTGSGAAGAPHGPAARSSSGGGGGILSSLFRQGSSSAAADTGSTQQQIAGSPQPSSSVLPGQKHYRWSDKEVRRASGLSYDELVDASLSYLSESDADSPDGYTSPDAQIGRAAAAFAAQAAAGAGAAAAAAAAATAAEDPAASVLGRSPGGGIFRGAVARAASASEPLLLQHGLKLSSSYKSVLGQEPDYTSSHSQFMDCCDYIWYTSTPLTPQSSSMMQDQQQAATSSSTSSSNGGCGCYELRPVAVLQPPDGMKLNKGLPSKNLGSDHICLLTDFELVLKQ